MKYRSNKFTVYATKLQGVCVKEARTCLNYGKACGSCVRVQGRFTNYETAGMMLSLWQRKILTLSAERKK